MTKISLSRPKDKSFEAFKKWIKEINKNFGGKETATDAKYKKAWEKFWA